MPCSRLAARLFELSHAQLLEIAVAGCEASSEVMHRADLILATHKPLAQWAVEGVLLSSDLVPHLLAPLQLEDGVAAAVCSRWADGWRATSEGRRLLTKVAFDFGQEWLDTDNSAPNFELTVIPGDDNHPGDDQLLVISGKMTYVLDRSMDIVDSWSHNVGRTWCGPIAANELSLYASEMAYSQRLCRINHEGSARAQFLFEEGFSGLSIVLAPGELLFCSVLDEHAAVGHEIIALDAQSMQLRYRFGRALLKDAWGLAVVGEELFVCDRGSDLLQVFSLAGEHRRSITGEWKRPADLCFIKDRIYLVEDGSSEDEEDDGEEDASATNPTHGRRIFVLSLQGETLQVYTVPFASRHYVGEELLYFDGKLLVSQKDAGIGSITGVMALLGV